MPKKRKYTCFVLVADDGEETHFDYTEALRKYCNADRMVMLGIDKEGKRTLIYSKGWIEESKSPSIIESAISGI